MEFADHYPLYTALGSADPAPNPQLPSPSPHGPPAAPFLAPPPPPPQPATRFVKRGGYIVCCTCGYAKEFCRGHVAPQIDGPPPVSDLIARARACGDVK